MRKITFLFLIFCSISLAQQSYHFDYLLEYEYQRTANDSIENLYILTNSGDNSYSLTARRIKNESMFAINFNKMDETHVQGKVTEEDFLKAETLVVDCSSVKPLINPYKFRTKEYMYVRQPDTVLYEQKHMYYVFMHVNPRKEKRKKIVRSHYIIQPNTEEHLPVLLHATAYEEWKRERSIPNGIFAYKYYVSREADTTGIHKLIKIYKVDKYLQHPNDCEPLTLTITIETAKPFGKPSGY